MQSRNVILEVISPRSRNDHYREGRKESGVFQPFTMLSSSDDAVILPPSAPKRREPRPPSSRALPRQYLNSGFSRPPIYTYATHQDASAYPIITPEDSASRSLGLYRPTSSRLVVSSPPVLSRPSTASASILRNRRPIDLDWTAAQKIFEFTQKYLNDQERVEEEAIKAEVMERRARQKSVAFIEQSKQPDGESTHQNQQPEKSSEELEHENFMSKVNAILVNESIKSLPTTASSSLHRPKTAPSTRYKGSDTQSEQSKFVQKKSSSAKEKGDSMTLPRRASTAQQKARPVPKTEPNEEAAKRPFTAPIRSKQKKGSKLSVEEAREVMQFFETSQLFATKRLSDKPKTLADWRIAQRSGDASWNPSDFSVQAFMSGYMKKRAQAEDTLIRRASRMSTFVPVSKKAAAQKLPGIAEATDLPLAQQKSKHLTHIRLFNVYSVKGVALFLPKSQSQSKKRQTDDPHSTCINISGKWL